MKNVLNINNSKGRNFNVKIVYKGDAYGRDNCLTHDEDRPLVEFYDGTHAAGGRFDPEGQFVSRYYAETLIEGNSRNTGLDLMGYEPVWTLYRPEMAVVVGWIENQINA